MVDQLPEINPFSLEVPTTARALDPDMYEYLLKLNRTLRDQHNRSQAGDTTFDWRVLLGLDSLPRYTPGSLGSFSHPVYGLIRARYVRFRATDKNPNARVAGFAAGVAGLEWEVVNAPDRAQDKLPCGVIASETIPGVGDYGWVITEGINLHELYYDKKPLNGGLLRWGRGVVGQLLANPTQSAPGWLVPVASVRVRLEAGSGGGAGGFGPSAINDTPFDFGKQLVEFENRLDLVNANSNLFISILGRRVSELTDDRASLELYEQLQAGANWANLAQTAAGQAAKFGRVSEVSALATQSYLRDAKVYRDQSGFYASSTIEFRNAASLNAAEAAVSSGQAVEASLTAAGYTAQALQYVTLAASVGENLVKNGTFSDPRWEANQAVPPLWIAWGNGYGNPVIQRYSPGRYGPYAIEMNHPVDAKEVGIQQMVELRAGKYLLGVDIDYISGTVSNSGVYLAFYSDTTFLGDKSIHFGSTPRVGESDMGNFPYNVPNSYAYSLPVEAPVGTVRAYVYLMNQWSGFGNTADGTHIIWQNVYLKRPAYSDSQGATAYTDAQITIVNKALADEKQARADAITNLSASFARPGTELTENYNFAQPWDPANPIPPKWDYWAGDPAYLSQGRPGLYGPYCLNMTRQPNTLQGVRQVIQIVPGTWSLACDVMFTAGDAAGAGMLIQYFRADGGFNGQDAIVFNGTPRTDGLAGGLEYDKVYSYAFPFTVPNNTTYAIVFLMAGWDGFGLNPNLLGMRWFYAGVSKYGNERRYTDARVTVALQAVADESGARAEALQQLATSFNGRFVTVDTYSQSINGLTGKWGVRVNNNNRVTGIELNSGAASTDFIMIVDRFKMETPFGDVTPFEVTATQFRFGVDLYAGAHRLVFDNGTVMMVLGTGFGQGNQFIEWFGPSMAIDQCTPGLAISYKTTSGGAYFGGALNAGIITNSKQISGQFDTQIVLGPFSSAGKPVNVIGSNRINSILASDGGNQWRDGQTPRPDPYNGGGEAINATWIIEYSTNGNTWTQIGQPFNVTTYSVSSVFSYQRIQNGESIDFNYWRLSYGMQFSGTGTITFGGISSCYFRLTRTYLSTTSVTSNFLGLVSVEQ